MPSSSRPSASLNMPRCPTSTPARWLSLGAAAFLTLVFCASTTSALPTNQRRAALAEPLFARASAQLGPVEPLERLRQRRNAVAANLVLADRQRAARSNSKPIVVERRIPKRVVPNPKSAPKGSAFAKRAPKPRVITNPKACEERVALVAQSSGFRRSLSSFAGRFFGNRVERRAPVAFRDFTKPRTIPNPKSPTFKTLVTTTMKSSTPRTTTAARTTTTKASTTTKSKTKSTTTTTRTTTVKATTVPPAAATTAAGAVWPKLDSMIAGAYYPDWQGDTLPPANINYKMFDLIHFAFAIPYVISTDNYGVKFSQWNSETLLAELIKRGHASDTKVVISIGGWSDSGKFSNAVSTRTRRNNFARNIAAMVKRMGADGVDIDWEYPGTEGASGNAISSDDTANFLLFLQDLRRVLPTSRLSTCTTQQPFIDANENPLADVSAFANVLDGILVMNYDVWGASPNPGPNAPLENACPNSNQPFANMNSAIQSWTLAGMPASKILMGVPGYGYVSASSKTTLINKRSFEDESSENARRELLQTAGARRNIAEAPTRHMSVFHRSYLEGQEKAMRRRAKAKRAARDGDVLTQPLTGSEVVKVVTKNNETIIYCPGDHSGRPCEGVQGQNISTINWNPLDGTKNGTTGNRTSSGGVFGGNVGHTKLGKGDLTGLDGNQIAFWEMINYGVLVKKNNAYVGTNGYTRAWDKCSSTPYLYDVSRNTVITYDDPQSLKLKGVLARQKGIQGTLMWEMSEDTVDFQLTQALRSGMGLRATG